MANVSNIKFVSGELTPTTNRGWADYYEIYMEHTGGGHNKFYRMRVLPSCFGAQKTTEFTAEWGKIGQKKGITQVYSSRSWTEKFHEKTIIKGYKVVSYTTPAHLGGITVVSDEMSLYARQNYYLLYPKFHEKLMMVMDAIAEYRTQPARGTFVLFEGTSVSSTLTDTELCDKLTRMIKEFTNVERTMNKSDMMFINEAYIQIMERLK